MKTTTERHHNTGHDEHAEAPPARGDASALARAGSAATSRIANKPDLEATARGAFLGGSVSATAARDEVLYQDKSATVTAPAGMELSAWVDPESIYITAHPGLQVGITGPDLTVQHIRYDFSTASFHVDGSARFDVFGAWAHLALGAITKALDSKVRPMLPTKMQRRGYNLAHDPDLRGTFAELGTKFKGVKGPPSHTAPKPSAWRDVAVNGVLELPDDFRCPLGKHFEIHIKAGTRLSLEGDTAGIAPNARLTKLKVDVPSMGVNVSATAHTVGAAFATLDLRGITVSEGGVWEFDYRLGPEAVVAAIEALGAVISRPQDIDHMAMPSGHMAVLHKLVDKEIMKELPHRLRALLAKFDHALPGFSMVNLLGTA